MDFKRVRFEEVVDLWKWRGMQELQLDRKQIQTEEIHAQRLRDMEDAYCTKMLVETARSFSIIVNIIPCIDTFTFLCLCANINRAKNST